MKLARQLSAAQMAMLITLGGIIAACGFLAFLPHYQRASSLWYAQLMIAPALVVLGEALFIKTNRALKNGIAAGQWPTEAIDKLHTTLQSRLLTVLNGAFAIAAFLACVVTRHHTNLCMAAIVGAQTLLQLRLVTRRPGNPRSPMGWRNFLPLRSNH